MAQVLRFPEPAPVAQVMEQAITESRYVRIAYEPVNSRQGQHHVAGWRTVAVFDTYENATERMRGGPDRLVAGYWAYDFEEDHPYRLRGERILEAQLTDKHFSLPQPERSEAHEPEGETGASVL